MPPFLLSATVTPGNASMRGLGETLLLTSDIPVSWDAPEGGTISGETETTCVFTPLNRTSAQAVVAYPGNGEGLPTTTTISVTCVLPGIPGEGSDGRTEKKVLVSRAISGRRSFVAKSGARRRYNLQYSQRVETELAEIEAIFGWHHEAALPFYWTNPTLLQERLFIFDSPAVEWTPTSFNAFDYKFSIREKNSIIPVIPGVNILTFGYVSDYAYEGKTGTPVAESDSIGGARKSRADGLSQQHGFVLRFEDRSASEFLAVETFWNKHYPGRVFNYTDPLRPSISGLYQIDSDLTFKDRHGPNIDYSFAIIEYAGSNPRGAGA